MKQAILTPFLYSGEHPIYGQIQAAKFTGSRESAEHCTSLSPNIISYYSAQKERWVVEVPTIAGEFQELQPGDYAGITVNNRIVPVLAGEVA